MRAVYGAFRAIAAANRGVLGGKLLESLTRQRELAISISIRKDAQCVGDLQAFLTGALALAAQAAVERLDLLQMFGQQFFVTSRKGVSHGLHVFVQLIHVGHAGNRGGDSGPVDDPFERCKQGSVAVQLVIDGIGGFETAESARHHLHADDANARLGSGLHSLVHGGVHRKIVGHQKHVKHSLLHHPRCELLLTAVGAEASEADLTLLLGDLLRFDHIVADLFRLALSVEVPDIDIIRLEFVRLVSRSLSRLALVAGGRLGGKHDLLPLGSKGSANHALVVAMLIAARGVEIVDAEVGGARNHTGIGGDHASETDGGSP